MQNTEIQISEIFYSIQGEGLLAGRPSVFVRLAGCPLRCKFCDTKYANDSKAGEIRTIDEIVKQIKKYKTDYIVITGGEPMICPNLPLLCNALKKYHITIETAGIKFIDGLKCGLMSISPKLSNAYLKKSDKKLYLKIDRLKKLIKNYNYQLKFVIEKAGDIKEVEKVLKELKNTDRSKILLMPQAANVSEYIKRSPLVAELCKSNGFTFSPRLQLVFGETRGI
ncbi:MAG: radical SAM protein [Planctomycetes bacterium HGW-Planctomycetes-1]|nr:MAG: radical SAM protein [Planctomycetes bacterium HGW-Planctomycetes-1]